MIASDSRCLRPIVEQKFPANFTPSGFRFGKQSEKNLIGVDPYLVRVVRDALSICRVDFAVNEGLRSQRRQKMLYSSGKSKTMRSKHLLGMAVDLVPYYPKRGGKVWDWDGAYEIAAAMALAELRLSELDGDRGRARITWGGIWDTRIAVMLDTPKDDCPDPVERLRFELTRYHRRFQALYGRLPFADGVHFEIADHV